MKTTDPSIDRTPDASSRLTCGQRLSLCSTVVLLFLIAGLLDGFLWHLPPETRKSIATILAALLAVGPLMSQVVRGDGLSWRGWGLVGSGLAAMAWISNPAVALSMVGVVLLGTAHRSLTSHSTANYVLRRLAYVTIAMGVYSGLRLLPVVRMLPDSIAYGTSRLLSSSLDTSISVGPTALGVDASLFALLLAWAVGRGRCLRVPSFVLAGAGIVAAHLIYAYWWANRVQKLRGFTLRGYEEEAIWFDTLLWLFAGLIGLLIVASLAGSRVTVRQPRFALRSKPGILAAAAILLLAFGAYLDVQAEGQSLSIAVLSRAGNERWAPPTELGEGYYEGETSALFGRVLVAAGHELQHMTIDDAVERQFAGIDVVILMHPELPTKTQSEALHKFAHQGGGILMIGDHTPSSEQLSGIQALLAPFDLRYRFDSAFLHSMPLSRCGRTGTSLVGAAFRDCIEDNYGVGASLDAGLHGEVLLEARWAVSDRGHMSTPSLLGNRHYEHGDFLGDRPLVCMGSHGEGRLLVFPDTGALVDSAIPFSYPLALSLLDQVAGNRIALSGLMRAVLGLVLLLLLIALAPGADPVLALACAVGTFAAAGLGGYTVPKINDENLALIDLSHHSVSASFDRNPESSLKGLANTLFRTGMLPLASVAETHLDERKPKLAVLVAPSTLNASESKRIGAFIEGGGNLWLATGYEERVASIPLMKKAGFEILPMPLGSLSNAFIDRVEFIDKGVNRVQYAEAWPIKSDDPNGAEVLLEVSERPVIIRRKLGKGALLLVADSYFFADRNLSGGKASWLPNQNLVAQLVKELR